MVINELADRLVLCRRLFGNCRSVDGVIVFDRLGKSVTLTDVARAIEDTRRVCVGAGWDASETVTFLAGRIRASMREAIVLELDNGP